MCERGWVAEFRKEDGPLVISVLRGDTILTCCSHRGICESRGIPFICLLLVREEPSLSDESAEHCQNFVSKMCRLDMNVNCILASESKLGDPVAFIKR